MQSFQANDTISNRYKVLRKLGAGAMGSVYLCEDSVENHIKVALKVLVSEDLEDQDVWAKYEYEALTKLRHPNLARVYNFGRLGGTKDYFIVSEFIKGVDLYSATEYLRYDELTDIIVQICRALEYIHSQGWVHFDIKPDNILVTRYKTIGIKQGSKVQYNEADLAESEQAVQAKPLVKLIDFGLAEKITGSFNFAIKGTLNYLAPEIMNQKKPDRRADLFSLGVTLFQVANRELPFYGQDSVFAGGAQGPTKTVDLFRLHMKNHPEFLKDLILKLSEENADDRFQSAKEVIQFINKNSEYRFEAETPETRESYFHSPRLVGRRREINLLKDSYERVFLPETWQDVRRTKGPVEDAEPDEEPTAPPTEAEADDAVLEPGTVAPEPRSGAESGLPPAVIVISGEMGVGKSRLLEEFQHYLKLNSFPYVSGNCYEGNRKAYQPFIEILRQLLCNLGQDSEVCQKYRPEILRLLPELAKAEEQAKDQGARQDKEKHCFIDRLSQFLLEASASAPYILAVNNLHWVDEASLDLLEGLLERTAELRAEGRAPKLIGIVSIRPEEPAPDRLRDLLDGWKEKGLSREVVVRRLKQSQIEEFLCSMLSFTELPAGFVAKLMECTGGNPLFIVETLKTLEDDGILRNSGGSWSIKTASFDRIDIPQRMDDLLGKRLEKLDPKKRDLLEVLSVLDKPANPKALQGLKRFADVPVLVELRNLEQSGITSKTFDNGKLHFQIAQPKVREIVYGRIPEASRQRYHGELADLLVEAYRGREEEVLEEVAYHYQRSDQPAKAVETAGKAGDYLKRIYANDRAYEYYVYVLDNVEDRPELFAVWAATQEKVGDLCTTMGRYEVADRSYAALLEQDVRARLDPQRVARIYLARGRVFEIQGDYELALRCYKEARSYLSTFTSRDLLGEKIRAFNCIGWVYVCMGKYEKAMTISLEALRVLDGTPERLEHAMVYNTIGSANYFKGNFPEAIEYHRKSLQIRENLENLPETVTSLNNLASAHMAAAEYGEANEQLQRALRTSNEIGDPYGRAMTMHNLARLHFDVGQRERGWECLDESLNLSKVHNMRYLSIQNYIVRGTALLEQGEHNKAESNFFRALSVFSKQANRWGLCTALIPLSRLHRLAGNLTEARSTVAEARRYARELEILHLQTSALLEEARLRRLEGPEGLAKAVELLEEAAPLAERCRQPELLAEVHAELGETLATAREIRKAKEHYEVAQEKFNEVVENLPEAFRDSYRSSKNALFRNWRGGGTDGSRPPQAPETAPVASDAPSRAAGSESRPRLDDSLERVNRLMGLLLSRSSLKEFLDRLIEDVLSVVAGEHAYVLFVQAGEVAVEAHCTVSGKAPLDAENALSMDLVERVLQSRSSYVLADVADDPDVARELESRGGDVRSLLIAPFHVDQQWCTVLYIVNAKIPGTGAQQASQALQPFVHLASLAYRQLTPEALPARP